MPLSLVQDQGLALLGLSLLRVITAITGIMFVIIVMHCRAATYL